MRTYQPPKVIPSPQPPQPPGLPPAPGQPPGQPPPTNRAPQWPNPFQHQTTTSFQYDTLGRLVGATTTINIITAAVDPDGDPVSYDWSASNGTISGAGLSATWNRVISSGFPQAGTVSVTASDGKGGATPFQIRFL